MVLKSFVLIEKENHYLLIREASKKWKGKWFLPGGRVDIGETPENAAYRETKEEAGCDIDIKGIFYLIYKDHILEKSLSLFYVASIVGEESIKQIADKHSLEVKWFTYEEIKTLPLRQKLLEILGKYNKYQFIPSGNFKII